MRCKGAHKQLARVSLRAGSHCVNFARSFNCLEWSTTPSVFLAQDQTQTVSTVTKDNPIRIILPFKDQISADIVKEIIN